MKVTTPDHETKLVQFYFNINSKIKKPQIQNTGQQLQLPQQAAELEHKTNLEESELKIVHKDKWPLPLSNTRFIRYKSENKG